ncbi:uncharacterized protein [Polyergus mexicanus]|uniref:uncharacterized protein n=1 Tax=Polyergus mexicanus TaxID=615972 RepID=UPI0038B60745
MSKELCFEAENATKMRSNSHLWFELRYGRITASILHEAANCNTEDGSLVQRITGASKVYDTKEMERGRCLEKEVLKKVEKIVGQKLKNCGLFLMPNYPILGASPDAMGNDFIVEVKCPNSDKAISRFPSKGKVASKCKAQINLQILATNTKKGLFCVADPDFENNRKVTTVWVDYDKDYTTAVTEQAISFWKKNIYCAWRFIKAATIRTTMYGMMLWFKVECGSKSENSRSLLITRST